MIGEDAFCRPSWAGCDIVRLTEFYCNLALTLLCNYFTRVLKEKYCW